MKLVYSKNSNKNCHPDHAWTCNLVRDDGSLYNLGHYFTKGFGPTKEWAKQNLQECINKDMESKMRLLRSLLTFVTEN